MIDRFSRWPEAIPLPNMAAQTIAAAFIDGWVVRFGTPAVITTDQGKQFEVFSRHSRNSWAARRLERLLITELQTV